jgi:hypothetical protein
MIIVYCSPFYHGAMMSEEVEVEKRGMDDGVRFLIAHFS